MSNSRKLASISYNDGVTPSVTYLHDRLGRPGSVVCNGTTTSFAYDLANDVLSESYAGGTLGGLTVTNQFDTDLRRTNSALKNGSTTLCQALYTYDNASRLASVSDGTNVATNTYLANSSLVGQIGFKSNTVTRMTTSKQYDYLNRLSSIASTPSNAFTYQYNAANQRTMNQLADGSYWRYGYDALGQVTLGNKYWVDETIVAGQQFDYTFDTIGNRTQTLAGGDQNGANLRLANYTNNSLNQITSRGVPAAVDVLGDGLATNGVTVNGLTAYRKNEYFRQQLSVTNSSAAVWDSITVAATGQTSVTGHAYVAQAPENLTYDVDGNLLSDGRWTYTWDGENRLVGLKSLTSAPSGSLLQLAFTYDYMGRRIQKTVYTNNGTSYIGEYTNKYAYDGWNCLAILNPSLVLSNSFMWGSDPSGSIQGAGGIGGLLKVTYYGTTTTNCFVAYDGNGNVSALVNAADGTTSATYEYGPFGEVIRQSGPMAKLNPFRFSTKYDDDETDMLYYGYRYYNPSTGRWLSKDPAEEDEGGPNLYGFNGNDGVDRMDAWGLWPSSSYFAGYDFWGVPLVHQNAIHRAIVVPNGLSAADEDILDSATLLVDQDQSTGGAYKHAMSAPGQSAAFASSLGNFWVKFHILIAENNLCCDNYNRQLALTHFGLALHTIQDFTSPAHTGFQVWHGLGSVWDDFLAIRHFNRENFDPGPSSHLDKATKWLWTFFTCIDSAPPLPPDVFAGLGYDKDVLRAGL